MYTAEVNFVVVFVIVVAVVVIVVATETNANFDSAGHCHGWRYFQSEMDSCE